jgi:hypothetical protein
MQKIDHTIGFQEKRQFALPKFGKKSQKIAIYP